MWKMSGGSLEQLAVSGWSCRIVSATDYSVHTCHFISYTCQDFLFKASYLLLLTFSFVDEIKKGFFCLFYFCLFYLRVKPEKLKQFSVSTSSDNIKRISVCGFLQVYIDRLFYNTIALQIQYGLRALIPISTLCVKFACALGVSPIYYNFLPQTSLSFFFCFCFSKCKWKVPSIKTITMLNLMWVNSSIMCFANIMEKPCVIPGTKKLHFISWTGEKLHELFKEAEEQRHW